MKNHPRFTGSLFVLTALMFCTLPASPGRAQDTSGVISGNWTTQADQLRGKNGGQFTFSFLGGGAPSGRLWGTDVYTDDSSIATAAVHAGLITTKDGGTVTIEIRPGQGSYAGSERNGVTSQSYGGWDGSFVFVEGKPAQAAAPAAPGAGAARYVLVMLGAGRERHEFGIDFSARKVTEINADPSSGESEIAVKECIPGKRLVMRISFPRTSHWVECDLVFMEEGRVVGGFWRDPVTCGPVTGALVP